MEDHAKFLASAKRVITVEADALKQLASQLDDSFGQAVALLLNAKGRVIISGMGKSGHIARKIAATVDALGASRFDMKYSAGTLPHETLMRSIELYGTAVAPRVRELLASRTAATS